MNCSEDPIEYQYQFDRFYRTVSFCYDYSVYKEYQDVGVDGIRELK